MATLEALNKKIDDQGAVLRDIQHAVRGNPTLGQKGIIPRLEDLEAARESDKKIKGMIVGASAGGGLAAGIFGWPMVKKFLAFLGFILK